MEDHGCADYEGLWVRWDGSYYMGYCQLCESTMPRKTPLNSLASVIVWHDCHHGDCTPTNASPTSPPE